MPQPIDYADREVKGLERYLPSRLSKILACAVVTAPASVFAFLTLNKKNIPIGTTNLEHLLGSFTATFIVATLIMLFLVFELLSIINSSKHSCIKHWSQEHPLMTFKWLASNATLKHYMFLFGIFLIGFALCLIILYFSPNFILKLQQVRT